MSQNLEREKLQSDQIGEIMKALSKAQSKFPKILKNKQGYGYKYADLESLINAIGETLGENNLSFTQYLDEVDGNHILYTILSHENGQWIKSKIKLILDHAKKMSPMQNLGSAITYARRYGLQTIVGVSSDEDTDDAQQKDQGNKKPKNNYAKPNDNSMPPKKENPTIGRIVRIIKGLSDEKKQNALKSLSIKEPSDLKMVGDGELLEMEAWLVKGEF